MEWIRKQGYWGLHPSKEFEVEASGSRRGTETAKLLWPFKKKKHPSGCFLGRKARAGVWKTVRDESENSELPNGKQEPLVFVTGSFLPQTTKEAGVVM